MRSVRSVALDDPRHAPSASVVAVLTSERGQRAVHRDREVLRRRRGIGYIVREPDRHEILVRSSGLALGVDALYEGDRVAFDIDMGTNAQARNVMRT